MVEPEPAAIAAILVMLLGSRKVSTVLGSIGIDVAMNAAMDELVPNSRKIVCVPEFATQAVVCSFWWPVLGCPAGYANP